MLLWDDVRYFLAIQRSGSLSGAGRTLGVNQSTVGRRLRVLEKALEARLFDRTPDGYLLAPAGERLLPRAQAMEDDAAAALLELSGQERRLTGSVRLTAPETFGSRFVTPLLPAFLARYPEIDVEFVADNRLLNLSKREADVSLRLNRPTQANLVVRRAGTVGNALYASREYLKNRPWPTLKTLAKHELVGFDETVCRWSEAVWFEKVAAGARVRCRVNTTHAVYYAVEAGLGVGHLPCYIAEGNPRLVRVVGAKEVAADPLWLVLHRDLRPSARIRALIDYLVERLSALRAELEGPQDAARRA